jgi:hypothetical protein
MGFTTKVLLPISTFGMAGTWSGDIIAEARGHVERVFGGGQFRGMQFSAHE